MKIYDISQEVFAWEVYPGDPIPEKTTLKSMEKGELYNLTSFSMCAHNGTHIDAPFHFIKDGKTVDKICPESFVGMAYVAQHRGVVTGDDAVAILKKAKEQNVDAAKRILMFISTGTGNLCSCTPSGLKALKIALPNPYFKEAM